MAQEIRIALLENKKIVELFFEHKTDKGIIGNIYKGKVVRVLPGMQAAFVDIGQERAAFLYAGDFYSLKQNLNDLDDEDFMDHRRHKRRRYEEVPPIAELVREGQEILVQVAKGAVGTKGARLSCYISLPGRFLVFMPSLKHNGVSKKIESYEERRLLKKMIDHYQTKEGGFIVRTAAAHGIHENQIKEDVEYLLDLWKKITRKYENSSAPQLLHYDLDLTSRVIRDYLEDKVDRLWVDSSSEHRRVLRFIRHFHPELKHKVELYRDTTPLFDRFHVEQEIQRALSKRVWLKSGGTLVIESTEALTSIDVNTGRFVGKKNLEETILKTNLEAAEEIVRQLRLRNIGGIIIIDFIDMEKDSSKEEVYRFLETKLKEDRSKTTLLRISNLGLVEMTRKRSRESLERYLTEMCPHCDGRGFLKSRLALANQVLRDIRRELTHCEEDHLVVTVHPDVLAFLNEYEKEALISLEKQFQKGIHLQSEPSFHIEQISLQTGEKTLIPLSTLPPPPPPIVMKKPDFEEVEEEDDMLNYQADIAEIEKVKKEKQIVVEPEAPLIRPKEEVDTTEEEEKLGNNP